jgi:hypothetical protein
MTAPAFQDPLRQLIANLGLRPTARLLGVSAGTLARYQRAVDRGDRRIPFSKASLTSYQDVARSYLRLRTPSAREVLRQATKGSVWVLPVRESDGTLPMRTLSSPNAHDRSKMAFLREAVRAVRQGKVQTMREYLLHRLEYYRKTLGPMKGFWRYSEDARRLRVLQELLRGQTSVRVLSEDGSRVIRVVIDLNATPTELAGPEWDELERNPYEGENGEEIVPAGLGAA